MLAIWKGAEFRCKIVIKKILLAADLSVYTSHLLRYAADLAKQYQAKLIVVHAVEPLGNLGQALIQAYLKPEASYAITTSGMDAMVQEVKTQLIDSLANEYISSDMGSLPLSEVVVKAGNPVDIILAVTHDTESDLVILGSHSPNLRGDGAIGAVAQKVLNNSRVPVFVVPNNNVMAVERLRDQPQVRFW